MLTHVTKRTVFCILLCSLAHPSLSHSGTRQYNSFENAPAGPNLLRLRGAGRFTRERESGSVGGQGTHRKLPGRVEKTQRGPRGDRKRPDGREDRREKKEGKRAYREVMQKSKQGRDERKRLKYQYQSIREETDEDFNSVRHLFTPFMKTDMRRELPDPTMHEIDRQIKEYAKLPRPSGEEWRKVQAQKLLDLPPDPEREKMRADRKAKRNAEKDQRRSAGKTVRVRRGKAAKNF